MKFLMISNCGEGANLLYRIKEEGNQVRLCILEKEFQDAWSGLLPKVGRKDLTVDKNEIVIFDSSGNGKMADDFRTIGHKVIGGGTFQDRLESDRSYGTKMMRACGIKTPITKEFSDYPSGREFIKFFTHQREESEGIKGSKKKLVFKPLGEEVPTKLTYVPYDNEDLLEYLDYLGKHYEKLTYQLQEFIEGVGISTEIWMGKNGLVKPCNHTIENKKLMNDDLGPSTGCSGNCVWPEFDDCRTFEEGIGKFVDECLRQQVIGPVDLNTIVNKEGVYGLEWSPRLGLDAICCFLALYTGDISKLLVELVNGDTEEQEIEAKFCGGIRLTIPSYPHEPEEDEPIPMHPGIPIRGLSMKDSYFYEVMLDGDGKLVHSGGIGLIACVMGKSDDFSESLIEAQRKCEKARIPDKQYRTDLYDVLGGQYDKFEALGG